jgi:hypothetical protein
MFHMAEPITYEVRHDAEAVRRFQRVALRFYWRHYLRGGSRWAAVVGLYCGLSYAVACSAMGRTWDGFHWAIASGFIVGLLGYMARIGEDLHRLATGDAGEVWTCTMTDEAWSARRTDGSLLEVPWKRMKIAFESSDAWQIVYGKQQIMVFRRPLHEAGLEDVFKSRVGGAVTSDP